jgi:hypothetical protein
VILRTRRIKTFRLVIDFDFQHYRPVDPEDSFVIGDNGQYALTTTHIPQSKELATILAHLLVKHPDLDKFELEIIGGTSCEAWRKSAPLYSFEYNRPPPSETRSLESYKQEIDANAVNDLYHWIDEAREEDLRDVREMQAAQAAARELAPAMAQLQV